MASRGYVMAENILELTSVDLKAPPGHSINPAKRMKDLAPFSSLMSVLINIRPRRGEDCLEIAHSSVRDYLFSGTVEPCLNVSFSEISTRVSLVRVCLAYWGSVVPPYSAKHKYRAVGSYVLKEWMAQVKSPEVEEEAYEDILRCLLHSGAMSTDGYYYFRVLTGPPLFLASMLGLSTTVKGLLEQGINPDEEGGKTGAVAAIHTNSYYKKKIIEFHVDPEERNRRLDEMLSNDDMLYEDSMDSDDGNMYFDEFPVNALIGACLKGYQSIVRMLLEHGAEIDAGDQSPLLATCQHGGRVEGESRLAIIQMLMEKGVVANAKEGVLMSALRAASCNGYSQIVELLLRNGANVNAQDEELDTALYLACRFGGNADTVRVLFDYGAKVIEKGGNNMYALHAASRHRNSKIVELLLKNGADVNARDEDNETALYIACGSRGNADTVRVLLCYGADINAKGGRLGTALRRACRRAIFSPSVHQIMVDRFLASGKHDRKIYDREFGIRHRPPDTGFEHDKRGGENADPKLREIEVLIENGANFDDLEEDEQMDLVRARKLFTPIVAKRLKELGKAVFKGKMRGKRAEEDCIRKD